MGTNENEYYKIEKCPHCGNEVTNIKGVSDVCAYCGKLLDITQTENEISSSFVKGSFFTRKILAWSSSLLLIISIILAVSLFSNANANRTLQNNLFNKTADFDNMQEEYDELQDRHVELQESYKKLSLQHSDIQKEIDNYKDQQATIDDLSTKLGEVQNQYAALEIDRAGILTQLDAKKAEKERAAQERTTQQTEEQSRAFGAGTVFWVSGGSVYHSTNSCATLSRSSNIKSGSVDSSGKSRGCKVCH